MVRSRTCYEQILNGILKRRKMSEIFLQDPREALILSLKREVGALQTENEHLRMTLHLSNEAHNNMLRSESKSNLCIPLRYIIIRLIHHLTINNVKSNIRNNSNTVSMYNMSRKKLNLISLINKQTIYIYINYILIILC